MQTSKTLLIALLTCSFAAFAIPFSSYTEIGKLDGNVPVLKKVGFLIHYKWFSDGERRGVISYNVSDTLCKGTIQIDKHPAYTKVEGDVNVSCTFPLKGQHATVTSLQLYDGGVPKEKTDNHGWLSVQ